MKTSSSLKVATALFLFSATLAATAQTIFFNDNFTNGSTLTNATPANPTPTNTAYQIVSQKAWNSATSLTTNDLKVGIAGSTSGEFQIQALFATNAVALVQPGDYIQLTVVFTNTSGILTEAGQLGIGLYNSGQVKPLAGGMNGTASTSTTGVTGGAQGWQGYVAQVNYNGANSRIMTRPAQAETTGNNQDLITQGSGTASYTGATTVGSTVASTLTLTPGSVYTEAFTITLNEAGSLAITNDIYSGPTATGSSLAEFGGIATNATFLTGGFDGLAFGYFARANASANMIDISSIQVSGSVTTISTPPSIDQQPANVAVPNGGSCAFSVAATGFSVTYQWHRNGTNLLNGGNISGASSSQLVISPASAADLASGANGYYVTVSGAGGYSTNSTTNSLSFVTAKNLTWTGAGSTWDLNNAVSWQDASLNPQTFNFGDAVTFDDTAGGGTVSLSGSYLSASSVTVNHTSAFYTFQGTGSFAGPGNLIYTGSAQFTINNANTYTGGTIISNSSANLRLQNLNGLGTGPLTLAQGQLELISAGNATTGINGNVNVADDFIIQYDVASSYGAVFFGNFSGTAGKTLTFNYTGGSVSRVRAAGTNTLYNANLNLNNSLILFAPYQASGSQTYNGIISGSGAMMHKGTVTYFNGANTYSGGMNLSAGAIGLGIDSAGGTDASVTSGPVGTGPLLLTVDSTTSTTGSGQIFASGGDRTIGNSIQYPSGTNNLTLVVGGSKNLTLSGSFTLNGNDMVTSGTIAARTIQVTNTAATTLAGAISDSGLGYGLIKTGAGALYLNGANTYTGGTTNNSNTTNAPGLLAGTGTIAGSVFVQTNSSIGGGSAAAIGTLTINNNLTLNGNVFIRVNKSLSPAQSNDFVNVAGTLADVGTGKVTVTNLGPALAVGDKFFLFNKAVTGGDALTVTGGGMNWTNQLAVDGSIQALSVYSSIANYSTNLTFSVSSGALTIGWPATHLGWILQSQTNALGTGLTAPTNTWFDIPSSASVTQQVVTVNPANPTVFFRLRHP